MTSTPYRFRRVAPWAIALALLVVAVMPAAMTARAQDANPEADLGNLSGEIASDGSSTVGPITQAVAEEFNAEAENVEVTVDVSGTGGGFERFCQGETDIQNASRAIEEDEIAACAQNGVQYYEFQVAFDGITVAVNEANDFLTCVNVEGLQALFGAENPATTWADLNPEFPDEEISVYSPGTDSGTYDFFVEAVLGEDGQQREDVTPSEDDNVLVEGIAGDENAIGYFGYAYYAQNEDTLNAVSIDADGSCEDGGVAPSPETIADGTYAPLSRPLYVYVTAESLQRPEVQGFMRFYIENAGELAADVGFVASPDEIYAGDADKLEQAIAGTGEPDGPGAAASTPEA